jgi:hypothetical protein
MSLVADEAAVYGIRIVGKVEGVNKGLDQLRHRRAAEGSRRREAMLAYDPDPFGNPEWFVDV